MLEDLTGKVLGPYRLEELIGRGGMATVYRAHQTSMQRDVAIKVMAPHLAANPEFVARFEREARVIARLQHPHILPVIDFGRANGYIYLVMQLIRGGVLSDKLRQPLTLEQVARFLEQIASALEYAHKQGVVHRDLKPTNVLLDEEENVYLTDFGIAKMIAGTTTGLSLTATGNVMGTPAYMAPEQWRSEPVDARTDIYALGVMLYEMLLGALPFQSDTPFGLMYKHFDQAPPPPRVLNPDLPPAVEQIVLHALAKAPEGRYASAQQMATDFRAALRSLSAEKLTAPLPRVTQEQVERATPPAGSTRPTVAPQAPTTPPPPLAAEAPPPTDFVPPEAATAFQPTPPPSATPSQPATPPTRHSRAAAYGLFTLLLIALLAGGTLWWWRDRHSVPSSLKPSPTHGHTLTPTTAPAIVILSSPSATETHRSAKTPRPTSTSTPTVGLTPSATPDTSASVTARAALALSRTAAAWTETPTPNLEATANAILAQRLTETAAAHTDTPTPDIHATIAAALTGTASRWTDTPTPTATSTATPSATPTPTLPPPPTATHTSSPMRTQPPTRTPTATPSACGALPTRLQVGEGGRTTLEPPLPTALRAAPRLSATVLHTLPPGQTFVVVNGPTCADGVRWWQVMGIDAEGTWSGWIGEGAEDYWIEPFEVGSVECPGAPPPRLRLEETGRITLDPPLPSRVRRDPRVEPNNILGKLEPGETFTVLSGPVCDLERGWRWWLVENERLRGWVSEGPLGEYWMEPWP